MDNIKVGRNKKSDKAKETYERNGGKSQKHVRIVEALAETRILGAGAKVSKPKSKWKLILLNLFLHIMLSFCAPQDTLVPISELRFAALLSFIIGMAIGVGIIASVHLPSK